MTRTLMLAATMAALVAPLLAIPAAGQNRNDRPEEGPPAMAGRPTMLRAGPEIGYPQVRRIEQGQQVQLFGCLNDRSWCDVGSGNDRGWVQGPDLYADYQGRRDSVANLYDRLQLGNRSFDMGDYWDNYYRQQPFYGERTRWQQHYDDRYQSSWGPRQNGGYWGDRPNGNNGYGNNGYGNNGVGNGNGSFTGVMLRRAYLRAGPEVGYPQVGIVRARTRVIVHGCLRDWSWCDIGVRGQHGWVSSRHIGSRYRGRLQSLNAIAPSIGIAPVSFNFGRYWDDNYRSRAFYGDRARWERQYQQNYRPNWGPRPERQYQNQQDRPR